MAQSEGYMKEIVGIWEMVKESLNTDYNMPQSVIDLWLSELKLTDFDDDTVYFTTDSELKLDVVRKRYADKLEDAFSKFLGFDVNVKVDFVGEKTEIINKLRQQILGEEENTPKEEEAPKFSNPQNYTFEYTFDNFIVGNTNKFAHAACIAVAQRPARDYNPLFIYGPSGLGKTHLMSAVVNEIKKKKHDLSVVYIKGDDFTNELIESLSKQEMNKFRDKYRKCDILLIDDIQFIAGKVSTQEEFFHTFNALYEEHKQIILSSDRPPKDIQTLEERLKTRFEWGLIADIQPPDLELRIAIIKKKAEQIKVDLPEEVLNYLAENLRSNIRQIEGAVKKLSAQSFLNGTAITVETAENCLHELLGGAEPVNVTVEKIFTSVYKKYGIPKDELTGKKRSKEIANARHVTIYLIRKITEMSFPNIGKIFEKDHTTILASYEKIEKRLFSDPMFQVEIMEIEKEISSQ